MSSENKYEETENSLQQRLRELWKEITKLDIEIIMSSGRNFETGPDFELVEKMKTERIKLAREFDAIQGQFMLRNRLKRHYRVQKENSNTGEIDMSTRVTRGEGWKIRADTGDKIENKMPPENVPIKELKKFDGEINAILDHKHVKDTISYDELVGRALFDFDPPKPEPEINPIEAYIHNLSVYGPNPHPNRAPQPGVCPPFPTQARGNAPEQENIYRKILEETMSRLAEINNQDRENLSSEDTEENKIKHIHSTFIMFEIIKILREISNDQKESKMSPTELLGILLKDIASVDRL